MRVHPVHRRDERESHYFNVLFFFFKFQFNIDFKHNVYDETLSIKLDTNLYMYAMWGGGFQIILKLIIDRLYNEYLKKIINLAMIWNKVSYSVPPHVKVSNRSSIPNTVTLLTSPRPTRWVSRTRYQPFG